MDASQYKDYVLVRLFVKYISDKYAGQDYAPITIPKGAMLDEPCQTVFSGLVLRGRPKNDRLCNAFKAYCFTSVFVRKQIVAKASYTTRARTNGRILSAVILPGPPLPEQTAIAAVLTDMDATLSALEQPRDKTRALKQGMIQEFPTGKTRLI